MDSLMELKEKLVTACHILDTEGVMDELGHFSARTDKQDQVLMNGKVSPGQATAQDMVLLDLDGKKIEGKVEPAKEIPLHLSVYQRRPDVMAIAHTHSPTVVALSMAGVPLRAMENLGATIYGTEVPVYEEYGLVDNFDMGYRIIDAMGSGDLIVLKGHGNLVTGKSIEEACITALWMEKTARLQYQAMLLGHPQALPEEEIKKVRQQVSGGKAFERAWNYYRWKLNQHRPHPSL